MIGEIFQNFLPESILKLLERFAIHWLSLQNCVIHFVDVVKHNIKYLIIG
jgi:hypothetical protein